MKIELLWAITLSFVQSWNLYFSFEPRIIWSFHIRPLNNLYYYTSPPILNYDPSVGMTERSPFMSRFHSSSHEKSVLTLDQESTHELGQRSLQMALFPFPINLFDYESCLINTFFSFKSLYLIVQSHGIEKVLSREVQTSRL